MISEELIMVIVAIIFGGVIIIIINHYDNQYDAVWNKIIEINQEIYRLNDKKEVRQWRTDHINCRCALTPVKRDYDNYANYFRKLYPRSHCYINEANNICLSFKKSEFNYESSAELKFNEEFGKVIKLLSISLKGDDRIMLVLHVMSDDMYIADTIMDNGIPFVGWKRQE